MPWRKAAHPRSSRERLRRRTDGTARPVRSKDKHSEFSPRFRLRSLLWASQLEMVGSREPVREEPHPPVAILFFFRDTFPTELGNADALKVWQQRAHKVLAFVLEDVGGSKR